MVAAVFVCVDCGGSCCGVVEDVEEDIVVDASRLEVVVVCFRRRTIFVLGGRDGGEVVGGEALMARPFVVEIKTT